MNFPMYEEEEARSEDCFTDGDDEDMRQSTAGALMRVSKRVGGWATDQRSLNYIDTFTYSSALPAQWTTPVLLNGLVLGTGASQRVGREIRMNSIQIRLMGGISNPIRFVLVYDSQSNGAAPAITDIFETNNWMSEVNFSNRDRFQFVFDLTTPLHGDPHYEEELDLNLITYYNAGTAGTVADIASGALYIVLNDASTAAASTYSYALRLNYEE